MSKDNKWYSLTNEQTSSTTFFYDDYNSNRAQLIQYTNNPSIPPHPCSTFFKRKISSSRNLQKGRTWLAALLMNRSRCSPSFRFEEQSLSEKTQGMKLYNVIFYYYPVPDASNHCSSPNNNKLSFKVERSL